MTSRSVNYLVRPCDRFVLTVAELYGMLIPWGTLLRKPWSKDCIKFLRAYSWVPYSTLHEDGEHMHIQTDRKVHYFTTGVH